jgi:hypothetical protein
LARNAIHFVMCSHGDATESEHDELSLESLSIGYQIAHSGYCVAFIDDIDFQSSKVALCSTASWRENANVVLGIHINLHAARSP